MPRVDRQQARSEQRVAHGAAVQGRLLSPRQLLIGERLQACRTWSRAEGDLPADSDPADLARYVATVYQGMAVQAASGATRRQLRATAKSALAAWPT